MIMEKQVTKGWKGQAALEFLSYMSFFMVLFVITILLFANQQITEISGNKLLVAQETANFMAQRINFVLDGGDGFSAKFSLPHDILTQRYDIRVLGGNYTQVYINWTENDGKQVAISAPINTGAINAGAEVSLITNPDDGTGIWLNSSRGEFKITNSKGNLTFVQPAAGHALPPIDQ